ncbi:MAG: ImmA/IrrE family metallo-endopeptidase [Rhizobiales bacterium]|nr:ImmA/IrrE family metallo-endopeptidase [Hyphomicrobiales bacterium]
MGEQAATDWFSKPGDSVRAVMHRRGVTAQELSVDFDGGMNTVRAICDGSLAIDATIARSLSKRLGGGEAFWLKRQANFEDAVDRAVTMLTESERDAWLMRVPSPSGKKLPANASAEKLLEELRSRLVYFNVPKFESWERQYGSLIGATRFRTSQTLESSEESVLRWLRRGEMEAELTETGEWNPGNLQDRLDSVRKLSRVSKPVRFLPSLRTLLAEVGVALVVVRAPKGCRASGASRMVSPGKSMILMSFRHRADDHFWFTLFHEIGHLLLHKAATFVDQDDTSGDEQSEREANEFASSCLIPLNRVGEFDELNPTRDAILRFSRSVGVSPGITVGQLQHRQVIGHNQMNGLKRRWTWEEIGTALV